MKIEHKITIDGGYFFIERDNKRLAFMSYINHKDGKMVIDHTEVDESLKGQGIGKKLLDEGADYARANNTKIIPVCSFAKKVLSSNDKYRDVL